MDNPETAPIFIFILQASAGILSPDFSISLPFITGCIVLLGLFFTSGFISGAETAFFAITPAQLLKLKDSNSTAEKLIYELLARPKRLLASVLILINFINIAIVVVSSLLINSVFNFNGHETVGFVIQVIVVTFVIVLFCEVMPKVYAQQNALRTARISVFPVYVLDKAMKPLSYLLLASTSFVEKRIHQKSYDVSVDELTHAIDITSTKDTPEEEKKILKGIARFGNIDVRQIMKPRMDVIGIDNESKFRDIIPLILENRYSRMPVFKETFDSITGVLNIKDLLPYLDRKDDDTFTWQLLARPAYFVPESKKINDLLQEFQEKKMHLAIVVDEYGGNSGIVTLEDILEEIVGEINDEYDDEELTYSRLDDFNFVFEGKALLSDIARIMEVDRKIFETVNKEVDTVAGLILELSGTIPVKGEKIEHNGIRFTTESSDRRRIKRVKITVPEIRKPVSSGVLQTLFVLLLSGFLLSGCDEETFTPKPKGFFRIQLPERQYINFESPDCPFGFAIPSYSSVQADSSRFSEPCFLDVQFPVFNGTLYLTYKPVRNDLQRLYEEHRGMTMKHIPKATAIDEQVYEDPARKVYGSFYNVKGNAASNIQFYLTDSVSHFIRGSLYFYSAPQPDSIAPVLTFLNDDVKHLVETFHWR